MVRKKYGLSDLKMDDTIWKKATTEQFDQWSEKKNKFLFIKRIEAIIPFVPLNSRILDAGYGDTEMLERIYKAKRPTCVVGVDIREKMIKHDTINILRGDVENLSLKNQSFDCVIAAAVIEHLPNPINTLTEFKRVLKQGGILIITTPNPIYSKAADIASYFKLKYKEGLETPIALPWLDKTLKDMNFDIIYSQGFLIAPFKFKVPFADHLEESLKKTVFHKILLNQIIVCEKI